MLTLGLLFCPDYTQNLSMKGFLHDSDNLEVEGAKGDDCLPSLFLYFIIMTKSSLWPFSPRSHAQVRGTTELYERTVGCDLREPGTPPCYCKVHCSWFASVTFAIQMVPLQAEVTYLIVMSCAYTGTGWIFSSLHPAAFSHLLSLCSNE